jgi:hypothetical protein
MQDFESSRRSQVQLHWTSFLFALALVISAPDQVRAVTRIVPGNLTPEQNAKALKDSVAVANDGDIVLVRGGPYRFSPLGTAPHRKPLRITKNIQLIADQNRVVLDGGADKNFTGSYDSLCCSTSGTCTTGCSVVGQAQNPSACRWARNTTADSADAWPLLQINGFPSTARLNDRRNWTILIKNFTFRYSFRNAGYAHRLANPAGCGGSDCSSSTIQFFPGAGIEAWFTTVTVDSCYFHHNSTTRYAGQGGAVFSSASHITIKRSVFENNYGGYYGGAMFLSDGALGNCGPCCDADSFPHAAVRIKILDNVFRRNFGEYGGAFQLGSVGCSVAPFGQGIDTLTVRGNLMASNCASRFASPHSSAGSAVYIPSSARIASFRHNTIADNRGSDNGGAIYFNINGATVLPDSFRLNIVSGNVGGGLHLQCLTPGDNTCSGGADFCVQNILDNVEDNLFWNNRECNNSSAGAHVIVGLGRDIARYRAGGACADTLRFWTCNPPPGMSTECDTTASWRVRWANDPGIGWCTTPPKVQLTNKVCDPDFVDNPPTCPGIAYKLSCCSSPRVLSFGGAYPGYDRTPCAGTCQGTPNIVVSSMSGGSLPHSNPDSLNLRFEFATAVQADSFFVRFKRQDESSWRPTLICVGGVSTTSCSFNFCDSYGRTKAVYPCSPVYKYMWQARAGNCNGGVAWSQTKTFTALCITE